jgi:predicted nuclease with TOPRIM domain
MKLHSFESEVDKLTTRLHRALAEKDRLETRLESSDLNKSRSGLDRERERERERDLYERDRRGADHDGLNQKIQRLEIENDRLRAELERSQVSVVLVRTRWRLSLIVFLSPDNIRPHHGVIVARAGSRSGESRQDDRRVEANTGGTASHTGT